MYVPKMTTYSPNIYVFVYDVPPIFDQYSTAVNLFQKFQVILFTPSRHHNGPFTLEGEDSGPREESRRPGGANDEVWACIVWGGEVQG
jgi:hypothetical protein